MADQFLGFLETPDRSEKPRDRGLTMVQGSPVPDYFLDRYAAYIDIMKLDATQLWAPRDRIEADISRYHEYDIQVRPGGMPYELARFNGQEERYLERMAELGIDRIEYETHVDDPTVERMRREVEELESRGFTVVGEVGAKWYTNDPTRRDVDVLDVDRAIAAFENYLEAGCDKVLWDGVVVRNLVGKRLDNGPGQKALLEVADRVGHENIIFEVWGPTMTNRLLMRIWAWLVYQFGPEVNVGNVPPGPVGESPAGVPRLETIRHGLTYPMDNPYARWLSDGKPTERWWEIAPPPYHTAGADGLERDDW